MTCSAFRCTAFLISSLWLLAAPSADSAENLQEAVTELKASVEVFLKIAWIIYRNKSDTEVLAAAASAMKENLKDPDSAKFREERVVRKENQIYVCGEVNAKNALGGYVGYAHFFTALTPTATFLSSDNVGRLLVADYCFLADPP